MNTDEYIYLLTVKATSTLYNRMQHSSKPSWRHDGSERTSKRTKMYR